MKTYPSIDKVSNPTGQKCIAFYKYDGSNLRVEWSRKRKAFYKWGTRRRMFDKNDPEYGCAIEVFNNKYYDDISKLINDNSTLKQADSIVFFMEFFGPYSFAGQHGEDFLKVEKNSPKDLVIFDVNIHKKGLIAPNEFIKIFGHLHIPKIIYRGELTKDFIEGVRQGKYPVYEGVICKGGENHSLWMKKIKTLSYLAEIKKRFGKEWVKYWE